MPCPHCDAELDRSLAADGERASCPHCDLPLVPVEVAPLWRRTLGALIDVVILASTAGPIAWALHRLIDPVPLAPGARGLDLALSLLASDLGRLLLRAGPLLVMIGLYFMFTLAWSGRSLGHWALRMKVVDRHGQRPSVWTVLLRTLAQLAGIVAAALGPAWVAIDSERRALHDLVAGTYVVRSA
jgi:uncharacterized RDD family membrane protein YckC